MKCKSINTNRENISREQYKKLQKDAQLEQRKQKPEPNLIMQNDIVKITERTQLPFDHRF